jgi:hypothetical protein
MFRNDYYLYPEALEMAGTLSPGEGLCLQRDHNLVPLGYPVGQRLGHKRGRQPSA